MMSDEDLYDDLETDHCMSSSDGGLYLKGLISPESKLGDALLCLGASSGAERQQTDDRPKSLVDELKDLQDRMAALERENETLKINMGTLYRTAVAELQRKDDQIHELQRELSNHQVRDETGKSQQN